MADPVYKKSCGHLCNTAQFRCCLCTDPPGSFCRVCDGYTDATEDPIEDPKDCGHPCQSKGYGAHCCSCLKLKGKCEQCRLADLYRASRTDTSNSVEGSEVDGPTHYNGYEVLEFIDKFDLGFELGNAVKYIARCGKKNDGKDLIKDLNKALFYIAWEIKRRGGKVEIPRFTDEE